LRGWDRRKTGIQRWMTARGGVDGNLLEVVEEKLIGVVDENEN